MHNLSIYTLLRFIDTIYIHHVITKYVFLAWFKLILLRGIRNYHEVEKI